MDRSDPNTVHPFNLENATLRFQRDYIRNVLELTNWDLERTAMLLGMELEDLKRRLEICGD
jgi:transcriptional regulator with GAF, ATPase, and Fis domain